MKISRHLLTARHEIQGNLVLDTALHIGGGRVAARGTDLPVLRNGYGEPYIPGSSLKGALRATVERMIPNLNLTACGLFKSSQNSNATQEGKSGGNDDSPCLTPMEKGDEFLDAYRMLQENLGNPVSTKEIKDAFEVLFGSEPQTSNDRKVQETDLMNALEKYQCCVCKAFGSPFLGSVIYLHDAPVVQEQWLGLTQVRDGVGIDRDSGRAVPKFKYDYEIVPPGTAFAFSMTVESDDAKVLGLAALAVHELQQGNISLGGIKSRGLGRCTLDEKATAKTLDFSNTEMLKNYLLDVEEAAKPEKLVDWVHAHVLGLWNGKEN
ncbi:MAG: RAMP superfamily CRISPR-associated protein [bacterium]